MVRINNTGITLLYFTLTEKETLSDPVFLFEFIHQITLKKSYCIAPDISMYKDRFNQFAINNTVDPADPLQGDVDITAPGTYAYTIYEQVSTTNLNPELTVSAVETGIAKVEYATVSHEYYDNERDNDMYAPARDTFLVDDDEVFLVDENNNYLIQ